MEAEEYRPLAVAYGVDGSEHHVGVGVRRMVWIEPRGAVDLGFVDLVEIGDGRILGVGMRGDSACGGGEVEDLEVKQRRRRNEEGEISSGRIVVDFGAEDWVEVLESVEGGLEMGNIGRF